MKGGKRKKLLQRRSTQLYFKNKWKVKSSKKIKVSNYVSRLPTEINNNSPCWLQFKDSKATTNCTPSITQACPKRTHVFSRPSSSLHNTSSNKCSLLHNTTSTLTPSSNIKSLTNNYSNRLHSRIFIQMNFNNKCPHLLTSYLQGLHLALALQVKRLIKLIQKKSTDGSSKIR
jgi:hypothetical protein